MFTDKAFTLIQLMYNSISWYMGVEFFNKIYFFIHFFSSKSMIFHCLDQCVCPSICTHIESKQMGVSLKVSTQRHRTPAITF